MIYIESCITLNFPFNGVNIGLFHCSVTINYYICKRKQHTKARNL